MKWKTAKRAQPSPAPVLMSNAARCPRCQKLNFDLYPGENMCMRCGEDFYWAAVDGQITTEQAEEDLLEMQANRTRGMT